LISFSGPFQFFSLIQRSEFRPALVDFAPVNLNVQRRGHADPHLVAAHGHDGYHDAAAVDVDFLTGRSR
jgi:hypothetical protein